MGVAVGADAGLERVEAVGLEEAAEDAVEGAGVQVDQPGARVVADTEIALALRCCRALGLGGDQAQGAAAFLFVDPVSLDLDKEVAADPLDALCITLTIKRISTYGA